MEKLGKQDREFREETELTNDKMKASFMWDRSERNLEDLLKTINFKLLAWNLQVAIELT